MRNKMKKNVLLIASCLMFISGFAQSFKLKSREGVSYPYNVVGDNQKIQFSPAAAKSIFGLNENSDLVLSKTQQDKLGFVHYRFYQSYQNIPIEKTMFVAHTKNGVLRSMNGTIITEFDPAMQKTHASVSAEKAISIAVSKVAASAYAWQNAAMEQRIKAQAKDSKASYYPKAQLVFYNPQENLMARQLKLCYKVDVYATKPLSRAYYFVDASTGMVVGKKDIINHTDTTGTALTAYSGPRTIHSDRTGPDNYRLRDYSKGNGVITLHGEFSQVGNDYTNNSPDWVLAGNNIASTLR